MTLENFSPPGNLADLSDRGRRLWSTELDRLFSSQVVGDPTLPGDSPRSQFFNPLGRDLTGVEQKVLRWGAFPRKLARQPAPQRWFDAEIRDNQEEYCEWAAVRDRHGRVVRALFTTELPSYYHLLAFDSRDRLAEVYRNAFGADVTESDLITASGFYRERNRWNIAGAIHMIQQNNTLGAAVTLVAQSTIIREGPAGLVTNANDLIRCGVAADPDRNSDPLIVGDVNALARRGVEVTLADAVGLYMASLQTAGWSTPDGTDPASFWRIVRGSDEFALRAEYSVPADHGYTVSDITINGQPIVSPSQIAEAIEVKIVALGLAAANVTEPRPCRAVTLGGADLEGLGLAEELPSVESLVAAARATR